MKITLSIIKADVGSVGGHIDGNHAMFRITQDVIRGEVLRASQFEPLQPGQLKPVPSTPMPICLECGSSFWQPGTHGGYSVHFEDGFH